MAKSEPENRADLYRMLETSNGWFDGTIESRQLKEPGADYEIGMVDSESTHVSASPYQECDVMVYRQRHVVSELRGPRSCSLDVQRVWTKEMTFDEFKASEWWEPTIKRFAKGSCDASEIYVKCDESNEDGDIGPNSYIHVTAQCEKHYRDWLGNPRLDKGFNIVSLWLQGNGDMGFTLNGETYEFDVSELPGLIEKARAFDEAGVILEDGKLTVELRGEGESDEA